MPRRKLPESKKLKQAGIKLPPQVLEEVQALAAELDEKEGTTGRRLIQIGLAVVKGLKSAGFTVTKGTLTQVVSIATSQPAMSPPDQKSDKDLLATVQEIKREPVIPARRHKRN